MLLQSSKELFADNDFTASIESTTKSLENYRTRFEKYRLMLHRALGVDVAPLQISSAKR